MTLLTVVCPTISGREHWLERCYASYESTIGEPPGSTWEWLTYKDYKSCAIGWNKGVADSRGDYIHLTADDIEAHDGWLQRGICRIEQGAIPAARILNGDGSLQSCGDEHDRPEGFVTEIARIPLLPRALALKIFPIQSDHYYSDNRVSDGARAHGWESVVTRGYLFTHHLALEGRTDTLARDGDRYLRGRR